MCGGGAEAKLDGAGTAAGVGKETLRNPPGYLLLWRTPTHRSSGPLHKVGDNPRVGRALTVVGNVGTANPPDAVAGPPTRVVGPPLCPRAHQCARGQSPDTGEGGQGNGKLASSTIAAAANETSAA
jgi:hypothetical protein